MGKLEKENPDAYKEYPADEIGSLFGMTLWNTLANDSEEWKFSKKAAAMGEETAGVVYFKLY